MAKGAREIIKLESTAKTGYFVTTVKNKKNSICSILWLVSTFVSKKSSCVNRLDGRLFYAKES